MSALGCPYHPLTGRVRCPDKKPLRDAYGKADPVSWPGLQPPSSRERSHLPALTEPCWFHTYVITDIYSRYVVGHTAERAESAAVQRS